MSKKEKELACDAGNERHLLTRHCRGPTDVDRAQSRLNQLSHGGEK